MSVIISYSGYFNHHRIVVGFLLSVIITLSVQPVESKSCDLFEGSWVFDDSYPLYDALNCPFIDEGLNCQKSGRLDKDYLKYKWKPNDCDLSRFNGQNFLQRYKDKRIMFIGDSLSSNQWQSLACMLYAAIPKSNYNLLHRGQLVNLTFPDYGTSVMFLKNGFLVDLVKEQVGNVLKLDTISRSSLWIENDILIFNSYHYWIHSRQYQSWDYFQVGDKLSKDMDHMEAYKIAMTTWSKWIDSNIDSSKTKVFFQGISAMHFHGSEWDEPAVMDCRGQTKPIEGSSYPGERYPGESIVKSVLSNMKKPVYLLDITLLTQLRKDGHPSRYVKGGAIDCSHWCVAGAPDSWNELLYTVLLQS